MVAMCQFGASRARHAGGVTWLSIAASCDSTMRSA